MTASNVNEDYFCLSQNLTVRAITVVQQELLGFLSKNKSATIGFAEDSQVDLSFIQLMEAARIYAGTAGKSMTLARPAEGQMLDVLKRGGFLEGMTAEDSKFWLHEGGIQ
jgi:hypothetical protein